MILKDALNLCEKATWFMIIHSVNGRIVHDVFLDHNTKTDITDMFGETTNIKSMVAFGPYSIETAQSIKIVI